MTALRRWRSESVMRTWSGVLLFALTAAGWLSFALWPSGAFIATGTLPFAAVTIAWTSGAPTLPRLAVRVAQAFLFWVAFWVGFSVIFFGGLPGGFELPQSWKTTALPFGLIAAGWAARRTTSGRLRGMFAGLFAAAALVHAGVDLADGAFVRALLAAGSALWLAAVLASPVRAAARPTRRAVSGAAVSIFATAAIVWIAVLPGLAMDGLIRTVHEIHVGIDADQDEAKVMRRFGDQLSTAWYEPVP